MVMERREERRTPIIIEISDRKRDGITNTCLLSVFRHLRQCRRGGDHSRRFRNYFRNSFLRSTQGLLKTESSRAIKGPLRPIQAPYKATRGLSGQHEVFPDRQNSLLGLLKPIQDPHRPTRDPRGTGPPAPTECSLGPKEDPLRLYAVRGPSQSSTGPPTPTNYLLVPKAVHGDERLKNALSGQHRDLSGRQSAISGRQRAPFMSIKSIPVSKVHIRPSKADMGPLYAEGGPSS